MNIKRPNYTLDLLPVYELESYIDAIGRIYIIGDGIEYPSVTTVLSNTADKSYLEGWKASLGDARAAEETQRCAARGVTVHYTIERYMQNNEDYASGNTELTIKMFNQIRPLLHNISCIRGQEIPLYSHCLKMSGRCDLIGVYNGKLSIIDFKTSTNVKNRSTIDDYFLQCTAYSLMVQEQYGITIDNLVIIIAVENGICGLVFEESRHPHIATLIKRKNRFYESFKT